MLPLILSLTIALPIAWLASEFQNSRWIRITAGTAALATSFLVAAGVGSLERLNSNTWFGSASKELIDATVDEIENGETERLLKELSHHEPTPPFLAPHADDFRRAGVLLLRGMGGDEEVGGRDLQRRGSGVRALIPFVVCLNDPIGWYVNYKGIPIPIPITCSYQGKIDLSLSKQVCNGVCVEWPSIEEDCTLGDQLIANW